MVTMDSVTLDALVGRYLLSSAPDVLVGEVRGYLEGGELGEMPAPSVHKEGAGNGHASGLLPEFSPWQMLHVTRAAPAGVVDIAYRFWRRSHAPTSAPAPVAAASESPAAPTNGHTAAADHEPRADASDRMSALGVAGSGAPLAERSCSLAVGAFIESISGEHRFGIGGEALRIGVDPSCDVRVLDGTANLDARIWPHGDRYMLHVVAGSVLVNGAFISWAVLDDGDILEMGNATFRFRRRDT